MHCARLLALSLLSSACSPPSSSEPLAPSEPPPQAPVEVEAQGPEPVSAVGFVNGVAITIEAFEAIYSLKLRKYEDRGREMPESANRRYKLSITERLIYQEVLRQESAKRGLHYDEAELAEREAAQRLGIKDWDAHQRRRGESNESIRELFIAELRERALLEELGALEVREVELREDYEEIRDEYVSDDERVHAAHILIRIGPVPDPDAPTQVEPTPAQAKQWEAEARQKAKEIHAEVTAPGADFAQVARERSEGPSARRGGDLGIFTADRMIEAFSKATFALKPGAISKPVRTKFGFHIIKLYDKYPPGELPFEALEPQLRERLAQRKLHQGRRDLKARLLEEYEVINVMAEELGPDPRALRRQQALEAASSSP